MNDEILQEFYDLVYEQAIEDTMEYMEEQESILQERALMGGLRKAVVSAKNRRRLPGLNKYINQKKSGKHMDAAMTKADIRTKYNDRNIQRMSDKIREYKRKEIDRKFAQRRFDRNTQNIGK